MLVIILAVFFEEKSLSIEITAAVSALSASSAFSACKNLQVITAECGNNFR